MSFLKNYPCQIGHLGPENDVTSFKPWKRWKIHITYYILYIVYYIYYIIILSFISLSNYYILYILYIIYIVLYTNLKTFIGFHKYFDMLQNVLQCVTDILEEFHKKSKHFWKLKNVFFSLIYISFCLWAINSASSSNPNDPSRSSPP